MLMLALTETVVLSVSLLFVALPSGSLRVAIAVLLIDPAEVGAVTTMVTVALSPFAKAPMVHVIAVVPAQLPFVVARETNVVPAGMVSVNTTPVASSGPLFDTTIV